jgi:cell division protein FtsB
MVRRFIMQINIERYKTIVRLYSERFRDVRFTGQVIFIVLVLLISWSGVKAIQTNYGLQKQVASLAQQNTIQKLENENLQLQNKYYDSNQYQELSARQNFGLANPGEKEILEPQNVALAYTVTPPSIMTVQTNATSHLPTSQRNFEAWVDFFLHRQAN